MNTYIILLRGINVGGKNTVSMATLKTFLEDLGCSDVKTYINSGNVILKSSLAAKTLCDKIEEGLPNTFKLDSSIIRVLALTHEQLKNVVNKKPQGFGDKPEKYHSDVIFLMGISVDEALKVFSPKEGVDKVWPGEFVIYSQRLRELRTQSRLNKIIGTEAYKSMTIRNWNTTTKLLKLMKEITES